MRVLTLQVHETEEKLGRLRDAYLQVMSAAREACELSSLVLDGDQEPAVVAEAARRFVDESRREAHRGDQDRTEGADDV